MLMKIELRKWDMLVEGLCIVSIAGAIGMTAFSLPDLGDLIPTHLNAKGEINAYGNKNRLWLLAFLPLVMYVLITSVSRKPTLYNLPVKITSPEHFRIAYRALSIIKLGITLFLLWMLYDRIGLAKAWDRRQITDYMLLAFIVLTFGTIIYSLTRLSKVENDIKNTH